MATKKSFNIHPKGLNWVIALVFIALACAPSLQLAINAQPNVFGAPDSDITLYLLSEKQVRGIQSMIAINQIWVDTLRMKTSDSLRRLSKQIQVIDNRCRQDSLLIEQTKRKMPIEYRPRVKAEVSRIEKVDAFWRMVVRITNYGNERIDSLKISCQLNNRPILRNYMVRTTINPGGIILFDQIYFDLSQDLPLNYTLSAYPGGHEALCQALNCGIEIVYSDFTQSLQSLQNKWNECLINLQEAEIARDLMLNQADLLIQRRVTLPLSIILKKYLNSNHLASEKLHSAQDTARFNNLGKGSYFLVGVSSTNDSTFWLRQIQIQSHSQETLNPRNRIRLYSPETGRLLPF